MTLIKFKWYGFELMELLTFFQSAINIVCKAVPNENWVVKTIHVLGNDITNWFYLK